MCGGRFEGTTSIPPVRHPGANDLLDLVVSRVDRGDSPAQIISALLRLYGEEPPATLTAHSVTVVDVEISEQDVTAIVRGLRKRIRTHGPLGLS